jgi:hypothetical protein
LVRADASALYSGALAAARLAKDRSTAKSGNKSRHKDRNYELLEPLLAFGNDLARGIHAIPAGDRGLLAFEILVD